MAQPTDVFDAVDGTRCHNLIPGRQRAGSQHRQATLHPSLSGPTAPPFNQRNQHRPKTQTASGNSSRGREKRLFKRFVSAQDVHPPSYLLASARTPGLPCTKAHRIHADRSTPEFSPLVVLCSMFIRTSTLQIAGNTPAWGVKITHYRTKARNPTHFRKMILSLSGPPAPVATSRKSA